MSGTLWQSQDRGKRSVIYGRERERAQLRELLDDAIAGHGSLVLISGEAGIGKLIVPKGVGVRVDVDTGIGDVDVSGLTKIDGVYENDAIDSSDILITIEIQVGAGKVEIEVEN